jgi:hypothetical protein
MPGLPSSSRSRRTIRRAHDHAAPSRQEREYRHIGAPATERNLLTATPISETSNHSERDSSDRDKQHGSAGSAPDDGRTQQHRDRRSPSKRLLRRQAVIDPSTPRTEPPRRPGAWLKSRHTPRVGGRSDCRVSGGRVALDQELVSGRRRPRAQPRAPSRIGITSWRLRLPVSTTASASGADDVGLRR